MEYILLLYHQIVEYFRNFADYWEVWLVILGLLFYLVPFPLLWLFKRIHKMKKIVTLRWVQFRYRLAVSILILSCLIFWTQYLVYDDMKTTFTEQLEELKQQVEELQNKLSAITRIEYTQLPSENQRIKLPASSDITVEAISGFEPDYYAVVPVKLENPDPYNHIMQIARFKLSSSNPKYRNLLKFTTIKDTSIPESIIIWDGYQGTQYLYITVKDLKPSDSIVLHFPIYALEATSDIKNTEVLNRDIMHTSVVQ